MLIASTPSITGARTKIAIVETSVTRFPPDALSTRVSRASITRRATAELYTKDHIANGYANVTEKREKQNRRESRGIVKSAGLTRARSCRMNIERAVLQRPD